MSNSGEDSAQDLARRVKKALDAVIENNEDVYLEDETDYFDFLRSVDEENGVLNDESGLISFGYQNATPFGYPPIYYYFILIQKEGKATVNDEGNLLGDEIVLKFYHAAGGSPARLEAQEEGGEFVEIDLESVVNNAAGNNGRNSSATTGGRRRTRRNRRTRHIRRSKHKKTSRRSRRK